LCSTIRGDFLPVHGLRLAKAAFGRLPRFDINAACSGFIYALDVAAVYFLRKRVKHCADRFLRSHVQACRLG
jgi:3-oxoacyl-[acyl-carrier-protein] synthase-3